MDWLKDSNPFAIGMVTLGALVTAIILCAPKSAGKVKKSTSECGLKKISLNQLGGYLNKTSCSCLQSMFDGARFCSPIIGDNIAGDMMILLLPYLLSFFPPAVLVLGRQ